MSTPKLVDAGRKGAAIRDPKPAADSELALRRMKELLENAVNQLLPSAREVFILRDMEELPGDEVARRLEFRWHGRLLPMMKLILSVGVRWLISFRRSTS
jgi:hypothetical protein